ncbi:MAG: IS110-like element IS1111A family transposase [Salibacteraceae bacterium]
MSNLTIGLDTAKSVFHLVFKNQQGRIVKKKKLKRHQLMNYFAQLDKSLVALEACGASHYWARKLEESGHDVREIPPQYVTPYRKGNKSDYNDASAIAEAATRDDMRFVPVKSQEQQDIQMLHRIRERLIGQRTGLSNQTRGLLAEYGIVMQMGISHLMNGLPFIIEDADNELSELARREFAGLYEELREVTARIEAHDKKLRGIADNHDICARLMTMTGIGPVIATAMYAAIGNGSEFSSGRHLSAWLGLVPRQHSTGDKVNMLGITKRGNTYLRTQLVNGARASLRHIGEKTDKVSVWCRECRERMNFNKACVALANKMARMIWAMLHHQQDYRHTAESV